MNKLVFLENDRLVTDSLTIAETFDKEHRRVMQDIRELECSEEFRVHHFVHTPYVHEQNGQTYHRYLISQDGFSFLVMGYTGKKAAEFKERYINEFNRMREKLMVRPKLPSNFLEALEMLVSSEKEKLSLQEDNAEKDRLLMLQEPKVAMANMVIAAGNTQPIGTIAKTVGMGRNTLFKLLREKGIIMKNSTLPYQAYIDRGYFVVREVPTPRGDGHIVNEAVTRVTAKGLEFISKLVQEAI